MLWTWIMLLYIDFNSVVLLAMSYFTIRLWAQDFYRVIVDELAVQVNYYA